jgi:short-subunit dehydrogenase involved in D-alanine esterification of teichoic acids
MEVDGKAAIVTGGGSGLGRRNRARSGQGRREGFAA